MMIHGIGIDIVEVDRVGKSIERLGDKFLDRIFTEGEQAYCQSMGEMAARHFAARFAAKEAISKTLGTGIAGDVSWVEMEIVRDERGQPHVVLHGATKAYVEGRGITQIQISLTHTESAAAASAVAVGQISATVSE